MILVIGGLNGFVGSNTTETNLHFKVEHPVEADNIVHPAGFSRFPYGTHYDPKFVVLNYYDVWFSMDSQKFS
jgi:hypothetical protein